MNVNNVLVDRLATRLLATGAKITTAESCTGGWIAKTLTDIPGSSAWFEYGFVSYGDNAKSDLLDIDASLIARYGAVSEEVALAMVRGAADRAGAEYALAVTGIAGPGGGTDAKPVGTVWFAWVIPGLGAVAESQHFLGDRDTVRRQTVTRALGGLVERLDKLGT